MTKKFLALILMIMISSSASAAKLKGIDAFDKWAITKDVNWNRYNEVYLERVNTDGIDLSEEGGYAQYQTDGELVDENDMKYDIEFSTRDIFAKNLSQIMPVALRRGRIEVPSNTLTIEIAIRGIAQDSRMLEDVLPGGGQNTVTVHVKCTIKDFSSGETLAVLEDKHRVNTDEQRDFSVFAKAAPDPWQKSSMYWAKHLVDFLETERNLTD